jgi:hypothetical protein
MVIKSTRRRRVLLALVVGAAFIAAPAIGFFVVFVQPGDDWFVRVNGQEIRRSVLVELLRAEQIEAAQQGRPFDLAARSFDLAAELTEGEVLDQLAGQFGGPPSEEAIEARLRRLVAPGVADGRRADLEDVEFRELLTTYLGQRKLSEETLRRRMSADFLREQATALLASAIPLQQAHVHAHRIVTADRDSAAFVLRRAEAGIAFEQLAADYSLVHDDGDLGWLPYDALPVYVADLLWEIEPFQLSTPIPEPDGTFALYAVSGRDPHRPVDPAHMPAIEQRAFEAWTVGVTREQEIEVRLDSDMLTWLSEQLAKTRIS